MLVGAADTSDNNRYVAFVIGSIETVKKIHGNLGFPKIHMRDLTMPEKKLVIRRMEIKGDIHVACFHFNRNGIIKSVQAQLRGRKPKRGYLQHHFDDAFRSHVNSVYSSFLSSHKATLNSVTFECDDDMRSTFSYLGYHCCDPSFAHQLADVTSYCNFKDKGLNKVVVKDITKELVKELKMRCGI